MRQSIIAVMPCFAVFCKCFEFFPFLLLSSIPLLWTVTVMYWLDGWLSHWPYTHFSVFICIFRARSSTSGLNISPQPKLKLNQNTHTHWYWLTEKAQRWLFLLRHRRCCFSFRPSPVVVSQVTCAFTLTALILILCVCACVCLANVNEHNANRISNWSI